MIESRGQLRAYVKKLVGNQDWFQAYLECDRKVRENTHYQILSTDIFLSFKNESIYSGVLFSGVEFAGEIESSFYVQDFPSQKVHRKTWSFEKVLSDLKLDKVASELRVERVSNFYFSFVFFE